MLKKYWSGFFGLFFLINVAHAAPPVVFSAKPTYPQTVTINQTLALSYTLTNNGPAINPFRIRGVYPNTYFSATSGTCLTASSLATNQSCTLIITFTAPSTAQTFTQALVVDYGGRQILVDNNVLITVAAGPPPAQAGPYGGAFVMTSTPDGLIYALGQNFALYQYDISNNNWTLLVDSLPSGETLGGTSLIADTAGNLYLIATNSSRTIDTVLEYQATASHTRSNSWTDLNYSGGNSIASLTTDSNNHLYAASTDTPKTVWEYSGSWTDTHAPSATIVAAHSGGAVYAVSADTHDVEQYDGSTAWNSTHLSNQISTSTVSQLISGVGTNIYAVVQTNGQTDDVWQYDGTNWADLDANQITPSGSTIQALVADATGKLYAATFLSGTPDVYDIWEYTGGTTWVSTHAAALVGQGGDIYTVLMTIDSANNLYVAIQHDINAATIIWTYVNSQWLNTQSTQSFPLNSYGHAPYEEAPFVADQQGHVYFYERNFGFLAGQGIWRYESQFNTWIQANKNLDTLGQFNAFWLGNAPQQLIVPGDNRINQYDGSNWTFNDPDSVKAGDAFPSLMGVAGNGSMLLITVNPAGPSDGWYYSVVNHSWSEISVPAHYFNGSSFSDALPVDSDGNVYVQTFDTNAQNQFDLSYYSPTDEQWHATYLQSGHAVSTNLRAATTDTLGNLYADFTDFDGPGEAIMRYNAGWSNTSMPVGLSDVLTLTADQQGDIYAAGGSGSQLQEYIPGTGWRDLTQAPNFPNTDIIYGGITSASNASFLITADQNNSVSSYLYVIMINGQNNNFEIWRYNINSPGWLNVTMSNLPPGDSIYSLTPDTQGGIYANTDAGLYYYNGTIWMHNDTVPSFITVLNGTSGYYLVTQTAGIQYVPAAIQASTSRHSVKRRKNLKI